jgi:hypothetical protein
MMITLEEADVLTEPNEKNTMSSKEQANQHTMESGETACDMAWASASLLPTDRGWWSSISLLKILRWCRTACRIGAERYPNDAAVESFSIIIILSCPINSDS